MRMMVRATDRTVSIGQASEGLLERTVSPDQVLPVQFHAIWQHSRSMCPERELAAAVLAQAAFDIEKYRGKPQSRSRRLHREAYNWVASDDRRWPYSFLNLCDALGISAAVLRVRLLREPQQGRPLPVSKAA